MVLRYAKGQDELPDERTNGFVRHLAHLLHDVQSPARGRLSDQSLLDFSAFSPSVTVSFSQISRLLEILGLVSADFPKDLRNRVVEWDEHASHTQIEEDVI